MERTMLVNGRMPILGQTPAMAVLNHAGDPPDLFGYVGSCTAADAPDWRNPLPEDAVLDLEGALLLPGFCDLDIGLDRFSGESNEFYPAYRLAADALYRGVLSVGVRGDGQVLEALEGVANDYTLWAPQIARWNPDRIPSSYAVFYGAPEKGTREEEMYLQKVGKALRQGKIPAAATGRSPRERVNGLSPLVRAAELIHQGGYGKQEAIRAVTENNAFLLGLSQRTGCLKTGLEADVNVVPYEALEDLRQLQNLRMTARGGRLIWSHMKAMERIRFCVAAPGCE